MWPIWPLRLMGPIRLISLIGLIGLIGFMGCKQVPPEQQAMEAAQSFYEQLLDGEYEKFLAGHAHMDSIPDSYREQLVTAYKQFVYMQKEAHQGIMNIEASRAQMDSTLHLMQVFMIVNYADSTQEEIVVPMVEQNDEWIIK